MIRLRTASLEFTPTGAVTHYQDGTRWGALPHDKPHYHYLAYRYGHHGDTLAYCQAHELCHHLISEAFESHSLVLWALAHGEKPAPMIAAAEEALAMTLHRFVTTGEPPLIEGVDWEALKAKFEEVMRPDDGVDALFEQFRDEGDLHA
jgi:hypothetical protein